MSDSSYYLPGTHARAGWMRRDTANILKRLFLCEQSMVINQGAWLAAIAPLDLKLALSRMLWEDAMTAHALRERVLELRFPSRQLDVGEDRPLLSLCESSRHAPSAEAFVLSLARVFKPALLQAYQEYLARADDIADGPTLRFLRLAIQEKSQHIEQLSRFVAKMLASQPGNRSSAENWVAQLNRQLAHVGGLSVEARDSSNMPSSIPGQRQFVLPKHPARDKRFSLCRFYWPDIIDPEFPYGEGLRLQLRSAVSHLNEVWAIETAGAILFTFSQTLGWDFIFDAARWVYDESRHCRMGYDRLLTWGFEPHEIPLGTYIYDSARNQPVAYRLGMLYYFETKNIGNKSKRAQAFAALEDQISQHDMEFDWADEAMHAHFGRRWLDTLHQLVPDECPPPDMIRQRCNQLVADIISSATPEETFKIRQVAEEMIHRAEQLVSAGPVDEH